MLATKRSWLLPLLSVTGTALLAPSAAQMRPSEGQPSTLPVYQMARPSYDPAGMTLGSFLLSASASARLAYDNNIFASDEHRAGDVVIVSNEALSIGSQWTRHGLSARVFGAQELYARHHTNNADIWGAEASGHLNLTSDALVQIDTGYVRQPLARGTPEAGAQSRRPLYDSSDLSLLYTQHVGLAANSLQASIHKTEYLSAQDAARSGVRYSYRDRVSYDLSPSVSAFIEGTYAQQRWKKRADLRDFDLLTGLAGVHVDLPMRLSAEFGAGALSQSFKNSAFHDLVTPTLREQLIWNVLPLTSITANVDRTILGTETFCDARTNACLSASGGPIPGAPLGNRNSLDTTTVDIGIQHEFLHDILGEARFRYERNHFDFNGLTDKTRTLSTNLRYLLNRSLEVDLDYLYRNRDANLPADRTFNSGPYSEHVVSLTLKAGL